MTDSAPTHAEGRFDHDVFIVEQPFTLFVNRYFVSEAADSDYAPGALIAFCRQKPFALKEDLLIYADETMSQEILRIKARRVVDIGGRYIVTTPDGAAIGALQRRARASLLLTTWVLVGADDQELAVVRESSVPVAVFRRVQNLLQAIPLIGGIVSLALDLIPIPYHFDIQQGEAVIGRHSRKTGIRDRYRLQVDDPQRTIDRRLLIALGIGLDALQSR